MEINKQNFINLLKDSSIKGYKKYHILPSLTIAQAILETGWGKSSINNNIFGIKADKSWKGKKKLVKTHEYINGKKVYVNAWFRDYDSIEESLEDRFKFLSKPRYEKVVKANDYKTACIEIWKAGYATDPSYPNKLIDIIEQNKLYEFDEMAKNNTAPRLNLTQSVSPWALTAWNWTIAKGYLDGNRPKDGLTREEFAVILKRMVV